MKTLSDYYDPGTVLIVCMVDVVVNNVDLEIPPDFNKVEDFHASLYFPFRVLFRKVSKLLGELQKVFRDGKYNLSKLSCQLESCQVCLFPDEDNENEYLVLDLSHLSELNRLQNSFQSVIMKYADQNVIMKYADKDKPFCLHVSIGKREHQSKQPRLELVERKGSITFGEVYVMAGNTKYVLHSEGS